jgi:hypothetical protein
MCKDISPKEKINSVIFEMEDCKVEEDWDCIYLFWSEYNGKMVRLIFGKRANFYYNCLPDLQNDDLLTLQKRYQCFLKKKSTYKE